MADYRAQLAALQPPGDALPRAPDTAWGRLLTALANEFQRVESRALQLMRESDPRTTAELLPDWEAALGLPDTCTAGADLTADERRLALLSRLAGGDVPTPAAIIAAAARVGYDVTPIEHGPFVAGSRAGGRLGNVEWAYVLEIIVELALIDHAVAGDVAGTPVAVWASAATCTPFRAGDEAGRPLGVCSNGLLECAIRAVVPAHIRTLFTYRSN